MFGMEYVASYGKYYILHMDKELSKKERQRIKARKAIPWIAGAVAVMVIVVCVRLFAAASVKAGDIVMCTADVGTVHTSVNATGKAVPAFEEIITSPISSSIVEVYCKAGDSVSTGTPILKLDLQNTTTELNQLRDQIDIKRYEQQQHDINNETQLADMEMKIQVKEMSVNRLLADWKNEQHLDSIGSGTGDRVREAELAYNTGVLELKQMRQQLQNQKRIAEADSRVKDLDMSIALKNLNQMQRKYDDAQICAPRSATLTFVTDQIGQKISEGEKIAVISDLSHFKVDGEIADGLGDRIAISSPAVVRFGKVDIEGTVMNLTPISLNGVIEFSVKLTQDNHPKLRSGLRAEIYIMQDIRDDVVRIKNASFYRGPGEYIMFVREGNELSRRNVRLGASNFDYIEVVSGLSSGDEVVISDMGEYRNYPSVKLK